MMCDQTTALPRSVAMQFGPAGTQVIGFEQLLHDARAGSNKALGQLLDAFRRYLRNLGESEIRPELRPKGSGSDLVQDTYVAATRAFAQFRGDSPEEFSGWLRTILLRNLASFRRHYQGRSKRQLAREVSLDDSRIGVHIRKGLTALTSSPHTEVIRAEQIGQLEAAVQALPAVYHRVVVLRSREQLSFDAIGRELGCSAEAARKLWTRAARCIGGSMRG